MPSLRAFICCRARHFWRVYLSAADASAPARTRRCLPASTEMKRLLRAAAADAMPVELKRALMPELYVCFGVSPRGGYAYICFRCFFFQKPFCYYRRHDTKKMLLHSCLFPFATRAMLSHLPLHTVSMFIMPDCLSCTPPRSLTTRHLPPFRAYAAPFSARRFR